MQSQPRDAAQLGQLQALVPLGKLPPLLGSFTADGDRLALDVSLEGFNSTAFGGLGGLGGTTSLIKELPGDSWAAFGAPKYGQQLKTMLDQFAGAFGGAAVRAQLQQQYGIDLDEDIFSWMGDVAFFVRGDSVPALGGGAGDRGHRLRARPPTGSASSSGCAGGRRRPRAARDDQGRRDGLRAEGPDDARSRS